MSAALVVGRRAARYAVPGVLGLVLVTTVGDVQAYRAGQVLALFVALVGLDLLIGYAGQLSAGQGALFGLGAYATALLIDRAGLSYSVALVLAAVVAGLVGAVLAVPAFRIRGFALAIVTIGVAIVIPAVANAVPFAGGYLGLSLPTVGPPAGIRVSSTAWLVCVLLVVAVAVAVTVDVFLQTASGRALSALRRDERLAASLGADVRMLKVLVFALASALAGLAGGLDALLSGSVTPGSYSFTLSLNLIVAVVVGGLRRRLGCLLGAAFIVYVPAWTSALGTSSSQIVYAVVLLVVLYAMPDGVAGTAGRLWATTVGPAPVPTVRWLRPRHLRIKRRPPPTPPDLAKETL